jgi:HD-like signal output (HDOD) protein
MSQPSGPRRVLFVDDEPLLLSGLRRLLYGAAAQWETLFVPSGEAALDQLERQRIDVLITDMRMPRMDGLSLLRRVKERFPAVVRIALSGYLEEETALHAAQVAHQFIAKPCSRDSITCALDRVWRLQQQLDDRELQGLIGGAIGLPARPVIYGRLTEMFASGEASVDQSAQLVEQDVGLSAKLLHWVHSAFGAPAQHIASVSAAAHRLGVSRIEFLVLSAEGVDERQAPDAPGWSIDDLYYRSLRVAELAMEMLATDPVVAQDAFVAGMLHDVGQLVLWGKAEASFRECLAQSRRADEPLHLVERRLRGFTHAEIGAYLLGLWGLPYSIVDAVANHHSSEACAGHGLDVASAVLLASLLVDEAMGAHAPRADEALLDRLGIDRACLDLPRLRSRARI